VWGDVRRGPGGLNYLTMASRAADEATVDKGRTGLVSGLPAPCASGFDTEGHPEQPA